jgi:hypothetical protein
MDSLYVALHSIQNGNNSTEYLSLLIALLAVFFSPIISYLITKQTIKSQAKSAKEQIETQSNIAERNIKAEVISRNRQDWINTLRISISEFISLCIILSKVNEHIVNSAEDKWERFFALRSKISLLINPKEDDHQQLDELIEKATQFILNNNKEGFRNIRREIIKLSQQILKREWERVKQVA